MLDGGGGGSSIEPLSLEQRQREVGTPVGLKNDNLICYFNSLIQTYFMLPQFVQRILRFVPPAQFEPEKGTPQRDDPQSETKAPEKSNEVLRKEASIKLVLELQRLFAFLIKSNKKYVEPV